MSTKKRILKWSLIVIGILLLSAVSFGYWFIGLIPPAPISKEELKNISTSDLSYLSNSSVPSRGRILVIVTSADKMGSTGKETGYELTELARPYYVFQANGFEVDVASPLGGTPPVVIDEDDVREFDYAFLNDPIAQDKVKNSLPVSDVKHDDYAAIYFVGGKGAMYDFPDNPHIQKLVADFYESEKVVSAVCHGPAALVNVTLSDGTFLLSNKTVSSFSNKEELFLIPDAEEVFPFLLQDKLIENGASYSEGELYLQQVSIDGNIITGQNPWSTWKVAESIVQELGYKPKDRTKSSEENSVEILVTFNEQGYGSAKSLVKQFATSGKPIDRELIAVHGIVSVMQFKLVKTINLIRLLSFSNRFL